MNKILFLILSATCFLFSGKNAAAQEFDMTGVWEGYQIQNPGGPFERYDYKVVFTQSGDKVMGISECSVADVSIRMKIVGIVKNGFLHFEEIEILGDPTIEKYNAEWCRLIGGAKIFTDGDKAYLMGTYKGYTRSTECIPGSMYLEKKVKRA